MARKKDGLFKSLLSRQYAHTNTGCDSFSMSIFSGSEQFSQKDLKGHFGCVNAIEFSNKGGEFIASGGDDRRVLLWKYEEALSGKIPQTFQAHHFSNIFCLAFDNDNDRVFSGGESDLLDPRLRPNSHL